MDQRGFLVSNAVPYMHLSRHAGRTERPVTDTRIMTFDGSNDPEVCCSVCGTFLGRRSNRWWDDYTCTYCHETQ